MLIAQALACRNKPQPVLFPIGPPVPEAVIQEYVSQGDEAFQGMHLVAWRRAEAAYARAFSIAPRREIRDKLSLTRLLRLTREIDEDVASPAMTEDLEFIYEATPDARGQAFCDLAKGYAGVPKAAARQTRPIDLSFLRVEESPLDAYLFTLCVRTFGAEDRDGDLRKKLAEKYKDTPLFAYLNFGSGAALSSTLQRFPDFAEAWEFFAEMRFQARAIKEARTSFAKALEWVPDYTRPINGLANIYFFTLEDYANALMTYEKALKADPQNSAALFGRGAALHHLGRYDESNATMDRMLASDLSRRGRVGADSIRYFQGEGYYYKAHNAYLMKDPAQARALIDEAKRFLPNAEEINYLSGLLYYNGDQLDAAKTDMQIAAKGGSNCYAYHYLGLIELKQKGPGAASQFLTSGTCLERSLRTLQDNVRAVASLDIEATEKEALRTRIQMKLVGYRDSAAELLQTMIALIRDADLAADWKNLYLDTMTDLLAKVRAVKVLTSSDSECTPRSPEARPA
jgi:tetratricopeptide (TPR) repeat protein